MEMVLAVLLVALAGLGGTLLASLFLLTPYRWRQSSLPVLMAFAVGALLGAAFLELLPHALESLDDSQLEQVGQVFLATLIVAFLLEKFLCWRTRRAEGLGDQTIHPAGPMILISDVLHKFVDGVVVVAAFLTDPILGLSTALAVLAHEVPHELSALAVLLKSGFRRKRAFLAKLATSAAIIPGGLFAFFWLAPMASLRPFVLVMAAALFSYIALVTLLPELQREIRGRMVGLQLFALLSGAAVIFSLHHLAH